MQYEISPSNSPSSFRDITENVKFTGIPILNNFSCIFINKKLPHGEISKCILHVKVNLLKVKNTHGKMYIYTFKIDDHFYVNNQNSAENISLPNCVYSFLFI